jgi:L,D-peptidoglycan transpeptidase YkuD (ErfK/YbiS/YcfS/YnhG family)
MTFTALNAPFLIFAELLLALGLVLTCTYSTAAGPPTRSNETFPGRCSFAAIPAASRQILVVAGKSPRDTSVRLHLVSRGDRGWSSSTPPMAGTIGRSGFAPPYAKKEGDGRTPSGVFPLEFAFGYEPEADTRMRYRQTTERDIWVDDPASRDYNQWVKRDETRASSFEELLRKDSLYKYGLVVGYNMRPVVKGLGSAIFVHLWNKPGEPTSGCVAVAEEDMRHILRWLDPEKNPLIVLGTEKEISAMMQ